MPDPEQERVIELGQIIKSCMDELAVIRGKKRQKELEDFRKPFKIKKPNAFRVYVGGTSATCFNCGSEEFVKEHSSYPGTTHWLHCAGCNCIEIPMKGDHLFGSSLWKLRGKIDT